MPKGATARVRRTRINGVLVFFKQSLVLLAVPKTGTTAYAEALGSLATMRISDPPVLKHAPYYRYHRFVRPMLEDVAGRKMETVAVIREPVSWLGSWWRYRRRPDVPDPRNSTADVSFDDFARAYCAAQRPHFARVGSQDRFVRGPDGEIGVDRLFAYEDRARLDAFLSDRLNLPVSTERRNASSPAPLRLSPGVREGLLAAVPEEFALWRRAGGR